MSNKEIKVSVCCLVYNHEKYLKKCLDGFISQKTNFNFEVLIHDDASTDASAEIIREYERKYPEIIKPIYQKENQYSKGVKISWVYQYPRVKGKYIALCEGDDYWCDDNKLQLQYDAMEKNIEASICVHRVEDIFENGSSTNNYCHGMLEQDCVLSSEQFFDVMQSVGDYPFQTSSYFMRSKYMIEIIKNRPKFFDIADVGDGPIMVFYATKGKYIYLNRTMSCYRVSSEGSWNSRLNSRDKRLNHYKIAVAWMSLFDVYSNGIYSEYIDKIICWYYYRRNLILGNYKQICNKHYKYLLKRERIKNRIYIYLSAFFPKVVNLYSNTKNKLCDKGN